MPIKCSSTRCLYLPLPGALPDGEAQGDSLAETGAGWQHSAPEFGPTDSNEIHQNQTESYPAASRMLTHSKTGIKRKQRNAASEICRAGNRASATEHDRISASVYIRMGIGENQHRGGISNS